MQETFSMDDLSESQKIPQFRNYLMIVRKRIWTIVAIAVVAVGLTAAWNFKATPIYRASVQVLIEPNNPKVVNFEEVLGSNIGVRDYHMTQYRLIKSKSLIKRVVNKLGVSKFERSGDTRKNSIADIAKQHLRSMILFVRELVGELVGKEQATFEKPKIITPESRAIQFLSERLETQPLGKSRLVLINFENPDPALAADVVNTVADLFIEMDFELRFNMTKEAAENLGEEIKKVRQKMFNSVKALQDYREKFNIASLQDRQNLSPKNLEELSSLVTTARAERIALGIIAKRVRKMNGSINSLDSLPEVLENPLIQKMKEQYIDLQREYSNLSKRYKNRHPKIVRIKSTIQLMENKINEEKRKIANNILTRYAVSLAREKSLIKSLEKQKRDALRLSRLSIQDATLQQEAESHKKIYESLLTRTKETEVLEKIKTTNVRIVDRAETPNHPVRPNKILNILISMFSSLFFGVALAFFLERVDERIRSPEETESITGVPTLGVVSDLGKKIAKNDSLLKSGGKMQAIGREHFRGLRTTLNFQLGTNYKTIQITSCMPGEGKTFIASNLAMMMSSANKEVLLIDGDLKRPKVREMFQSVPSRGFTHFLLKKSELEDSIYRVPNTSLSLLPAEEYLGDSSDLLMNSDLANIIERLKARFDFIIVDSPPVLALSDPMVWSKYVDAVFFVVDLQMVTPSMLRQAMNNLKKMDAPVRGTISNRLNKYGTYYYYG